MVYGPAYPQGDFTIHMLLIFATCFAESRICKHCVVSSVHIDFTLLKASGPNRVWFGPQNETGWCSAAADNVLEDIAAHTGDTALLAARLAE